MQCNKKKKKKNNITEICDNPIRDFSWYWYKLYVSNSSIWFEKQFKNNSIANRAKLSKEENGHKKEQRKNVDESEVI